MRITAELSLYPLESEDPIARITEFIHDLQAQPGLELLTNQMSTQLCGDIQDVQEGVNTCMRTVMESGDKVVLVAKYLNLDLPIQSMPEL